MSERSSKALVVSGDAGRKLMLRVDRLADSGNKHRVLAAEASHGMNITSERAQELAETFRRRLDSIEDGTDYLSEVKQAKDNFAEPCRMCFQRLLIDEISKRTGHRKADMGRQIDEKRANIGRFARGTNSYNISSKLLDAYANFLHIPPRVVAPNDKDHDAVGYITVAERIQQEYALGVGYIDRGSYELITEFLQVPSLLPSWKQGDLVALYQAKDLAFSKVLPLALKHAARLPFEVPPFGFRFLILELPICTLADLLSATTIWGPALSAIRETHRTGEMS